MTTFFSKTIVFLEKNDYFCRKISLLESMLEKKENNFNYGIAILKMLMCFEVVLIHFWIKPPSSILIPFSMLKEFAVPVFMFLSFYFTEKSFLINDCSKTKKRIWRVVFPQIGWAVLYCSVFIILQNKSSSGITICDFFWQMLTGHSPRINPSMWFQTVLIFLTLLFILTFRFLNKKEGGLLLIVITLLSLWFQYSGLNKMLFGSLRYELKYPLGRLFEMIPYATLGFFVAFYDVYNRLKEKRVLFLVLFGFTILFLFKYRFIIPSSPGFGYSHNNIIFHVFFIVGFAYLLPLERCSDKTKLIIKFVTRFTLGIYCIHRLTAYVLNIELTMLKIEVDDFLLCIIIYMISFCTSLIICKISPKYFKQLVD